MTQEEEAFDTMLKMLAQCPAAWVNGSDEADRLYALAKAAIAATYDDGHE